MRLVTIAALLLALVGCGGESDSPDLSASGTGTTGEQEALCRPGDRVVVTMFVDGPGELVHGVQTRLYYPASVEIPGRRDKRSVLERIAFVVGLPDSSLDLPEEAFVNGATAIYDEDSDFDGIDDRLNTVLASPIKPFPDGKFVAVTFDCVESIPWPTPDTFWCEVPEVTDLTFMGASASCYLVVSPPPTS